METKIWSLSTRNRVTTVTVGRNILHASLPPHGHYPDRALMDTLLTHGLGAGCHQAQDLLPREIQPWRILPSNQGVLTYQTITGSQQNF